MTDLLEDGFVGCRYGAAGVNPALRIAAALQCSSEHPLARAVVNEAAVRRIDPPVALAVRALPGRGVQGELDGATLYLGSRRLMRELDVPLAGLEAAAARHESEGRTVSWLACEANGERTLLGLLAFGDTANASARRTVERLHAQGVRAVMMTGDNRGSAHAVARSLGIDEVLAEVLPQDKAEALGIPIAAGVLFPAFGWLLSPIIAAAAMSLSSVSVVTNALRLRRSRPS